MYRRQARADQALSAGHAATDRLAQVRAAGERGRSLVQQIVAFARQQPQQRAVQPLQPMLEETAGLLRSTLPALVELCLLYTSPSPRDRTRSRMPSSA